MLHDSFATFATLPPAATAATATAPPVPRRHIEKERRSPLRPEFFHGWKKSISSATSLQSLGPAAKSNSSISVWTSRVDTFLATSSTLKLLTEQDLSSLDRIRSRSERDSAITARILLRLALSQTVSRRIAPKEWQFERTSHGKPFVKNNQDGIEFSVSHANSVVVVAVGRDLKIGIDIESVDQELEASLVEQFCHPDERCALDLLPETLRVRAFIELWTRKEALTKMLGLGHSIEFRSFNVLEPRQDVEASSKVIVEGFYVPVDQSLYHASLVVDRTEQGRPIDISLVHVAIPGWPSLGISPVCQPNQYY